MRARYPLSSYAADAAKLLGQFIRKARIDAKMKAADVAARAGMSRGLLRRIEEGDPGCGIGAVFEVAAIVKLPLFDADAASMSRMARAQSDVMTLIPKSVRTSRVVVDDDF